MSVGFWYRKGDFYLFIYIYCCILEVNICFGAVCFKFFADVVLVYCINLCRLLSMCGQLKVTSLINRFQNFRLRPIGSMFKICCSIAVINMLTYGLSIAVP